MTTDLSNNRIYIGQHRVQSKTSLDNWYVGGGKVLRNIQKQRRQDLTRDILCECSCQEDADVLEQFFIDIYEANNPKVGYNIAQGGCRGSKGVLQWIQKNEPERWASVREKMVANGKICAKKWGFQKGHKLSAESLAKMKAHLPKHRGAMSEETKRKIGNANRGKTSWAKGKKLGPLPESVKLKISLANRGKKHTEAEKRAISEALRGRHLSYEHRKRLSEAKKGKSIPKLYKPVQNITTGAIYDSLQEARRFYKAKSTSGLSDCLAGRTKTWKKCRWKYKE